MAAATVPPLKISVLHYQPDGDPVDPVVHDVQNALLSLGHAPKLLAVHERVHDLLTELEKQQPDLVFNVCETFADDYRLEVNVAAVLELARVRFTGSGTAGLLLAQDKILTKRLLEYHEVLTPNFLTFDGEAFEAFGRMNFPLIVKPARSDASIGIGQHSVVNDWDELTKRVRDIRKNLNDEALAEEFIDGREVYVGVIGTPQRPEILPVVELDWGNWDPNVPRVSDRLVKFGDIGDDHPYIFIATDVSPELQARIERSALLAYRALKIRDYARVDFRISAKGEPFVLEVNPNPYLEKDSELAMAAEHRGLSYTDLIEAIIDSAATRYGLHVKPEKPTTGETPATETTRPRSERVPESRA